MILICCSFLVYTQKTYRSHDGHLNFFLSPIFTGATSYGQMAIEEEDDVVVW